MSRVFTEEELKELLLEYDVALGSYPEHCYEGFSAYCFLVGKKEIDEEDAWCKEVEKRS